MTQTINLFAKPAATLASNAIALGDAGKATSGASTAFARSVLATVMGGLSSLDMVQSLTIAAMGAPRSPKTGKPVAKVSGLRDFDGGDAIYNAWKRIAFILDNLDADAWIEAPSDDNADGIAGASAIRPMVTAFVLNEAGAKSALFGATGIHAAVTEAMTVHAEAIALHNGVTPTEANDTDNDTDTDTAPVTLAERIATFLVALKASDAETLIANGEALQTLSDAISDVYSDAMNTVTAPEAIAA